jgi:hypothetical protein
MGNHPSNLDNRTQSLSLIHNFISRKLNFYSRFSNSLSLFSCAFSRFSLLSAEIILFQPNQFLTEYGNAHKNDRKSLFKIKNRAAQALLPSSY